VLGEELGRLVGMAPEQLVCDRSERFRKLGRVREIPSG
jgi:hypothetical protein